MAKPALIAVAAGGLSAAVWLSGALGMPGGLMLSYFAPLPLLCVGLTAGILPAAIASLSGMVTAGLIAGLATAETFLGVHGVPAVMVVALALLKRHQASGNGQAPPVPALLGPGVVLACLALVSACGLIILGVVGSRGDSIEASVKEFVESFVVSVPGDGDDAGTPLAVLSPLTPVFLGFLAMAWQIMIALNAALAQWVAVKAGRSLRPTPRWSDLTVPDALSWPLAGAAVVALLTQGDAAYLAQNAAVALAVPYFFAGLATVHRLARRAAARRLLLGVFYLMLVIMFLIMVVAVTALGIADQWFGRPGSGTPRIVKKE